MGCQVTFYERGRWWNIPLPRDVMDSGEVEKYCRDYMDRQLEAERNQNMINHQTWIDKLIIRFKRKAKKDV